MGAVGMIGCSMAATIRNDLARWVKTSLKTGACCSSLAKTHGSVSSMYVLARAINFQMDEIGSNLSGQTEIINMLLELYDLGRIKTKLVKAQKQAAKE